MNWSVAGVWWVARIGWLPALLMVVLLAPVPLYLCTGWVSRKEEISGLFHPDAIRLYFKMFVKDVAVGSLDNSALTKRFEARYRSRYGKHHFVWATFFFGLVAGVAVLWVSWTVLAWMKLPTVVSDATLPPTAVGGLAGAYMWVLGDFFNRCRHRDFRAIDIWWNTLRFIVAVPVGYTLALLAKPDFSFGIAFALGAFPTTTIFTLLRRFSRKKMDLGADAGQESELQELSGVDTVVAERLSQEGYRTVGQLAWADPIDLLMRCPGFGFSFVIDIISEALAWNYFRQDLKKLDRYCPRGAQEISYLIDELDRGAAQGAAPETKARRELSQQNLQAAADALGMKRPVLERTFREIAEDPYTQFLCAIWFADELE